MASSPQVRVVDNERKNRFDIFCGTELAGFTVYQPQAEVRAFIHTEIEPKFQGHGLGTVLARTAMDSMLERATSVLPYCPFIRAPLLPNIPTSTCR